MEHFFELPVTYKNKELLLPGRLVAFTYSYKFYITVNGVELVFEKDDNGAFRVVKQENIPVDYHHIDRGLITAIIEVLEHIQS